MSLDTAACREALHIAGDVAALAILPDSQMTDEEALASIGGIVRMARADALTGRGEAPCGDILRRLADLTAGVRERQMDNLETRALFDQVIEELETADAEVFA